MRLKSIKLAGFKSFVDPTTVTFPSNLSAVVGPNGCGKSNIIDAVRWVMGESSARNLRGESMADVIFNGSAKRRPVGQASIELVFGNEGGRLGGEYAAYAEISIRRRVSRDGQSEYFLNGQRCRRRDITDIFLGTGLGPRSYAIIEQGTISRLIEARPEELRVFIEEAAGISRYRERRRETEQRMRRTQENLERLTDLREELERQLERLARQAEAARRYTELRQEERQLGAQLQALQWRRLDRQVNELKGRVAELELQQEAVVHERLALDTRLEGQRQRHGELNEHFNEVQGRYYALGADLARTEQAIQHRRDQHRQLRQGLEQARRDLAEVQAHVDSDHIRQRQWQEELAEVEPRLAELAMAEGPATESLTAARQAMEDWQQRWEQFSQHAAEPRQQAEVQQSRLQHLEQALRRLQQRSARLEEEARELSAAQGESEADLLQQQLAELELERETGQQQLEQIDVELATLQDEAERERSELDRLQRELQQTAGRRASLETLQQAALGQQDPSRQAWLRRQGLQQAPRLGEQLQVAPGWEAAVEAVLGEQLQAVCVDELERHLPRLQELTEGQLTLLQDQRSPGRAADSTLLAHWVQGPGLAGLLAGVHAVEDFAQALALQTGLAAHESVVTRDGVWLGSGWARMARGDAAGQGVLARNQELEVLQDRQAELERQIDELEARAARAGERQREQRQQRSRLEEALQRLGREEARLRAELSAHRARSEQLSARRERLTLELAEAREQYQQEQESLAEARLLLSDAIEAMEADTRRQQSLQQERQQCQQRLTEAEAAARSHQEEHHRLAMRRGALRSQLEALEDNQERTTLRLEQLREREQLLQDQLEQGDEPLLELEGELEEQLARRLEVEDELGAARRQLEEVEEDLRNAEQSRHGIEQRLQQLRSALEAQRLETQGEQVRQRTVEEQLQGAGLELRPLLEALPEEATESAWQQQLDSVGRRIARLGALNLAAIDEHRSQSERKQYLDAQHDELVEALDLLEQAIRRIDRETRSRFRETFDQVNAGLAELFPRVFGGGSASLELTSDDLLETGVTIMARPPGKRNSTIHLLSGGEKALTAIALVFAIFRLNPAPFCMLDEVDAPLDDANVGRYAQLVREMSGQVQFIYITHNKIAMEMADQLLGVTMQEPGVSRLVSVDVEEAVELAAS